MPQGHNTLHYACWNFHADVAEYLLDKTRIDPLAKDKKGHHALLLALRRVEPVDQGLPILELFHRKAPKALNLRDQQGKEGGDYLSIWILGIESGDADIIAGACPVHFAAMNGHVQCLKRLLELGVDRETRDDMGMTPLHCAAEDGQIECVRVLLDAGANARARTYQARAPYSPTGTGNS